MADEQAKEAFGQVYRDYWYPVFAWFRDRGHRRAEAEDLAQQFFLHLLSHQTLVRADASQGRFRAFLRGALRLFDINESVRQGRQKRGGGRVTVSLDSAESEERFQAEATLSTTETPDRAFDRRWGETILLRAIQRLEQEFRERQAIATFEATKAYLMVEVTGGEYAEPARRLGITPNAMAAQVARMRCRFGKLVMEEVRRTVADPAEAAHELRSVLGDLAKSDLSGQANGMGAMSAAEENRLNRSTVRPSAKVP